MNAPEERPRANGAGTATASGTALRTVKDYVGGRWIEPAASLRFEVVKNPATGEPIARVPMGGTNEVDAAVKAAAEAFPAWRRMSVVQRARYFFKLKTLMDARVDDIARLVTIEHGKTLDEARNSVKRGIENVEVACAAPTTMQGSTLEDISSGIDCETVRQPLGVFAAIAPFNFPAMVPMWFLPHAVALGNTFIVKPSEKVPLAQQITFEILDELGLPPGVVNMVNGGRESVDALLDHPGISGISFVGSTPVAHYVYKRAAERGKRVQALGGAKNFVLVMPDAAMDKACEISSESAFGCAGERCLANSVVIAVGDAYDRVKQGLVDHAKKIRIGDGLDPATTMGPVITKEHREKILSYIEKGIAEGATLALDGRAGTDPKNPGGNWLGPTIFTDVTPEMTIAKEEIFGPVLCLMKSESLDSAIDIVNAHPQANASSIFTTSGRAAREYRYRVHPAMLGVNIGVAAPMAFFPFGGSKQSFFGDVKAHGRDSVEFYTEKKVVISRW